MGDEKEEMPHPFEALSREQIYIYAKEIQEHFREERRLRMELEEQNQKLAQRVQELSALNRLFQEHLEQRSDMVQAYREVLQGVERLAQEATALARRAQSLPLPDLGDIPRLGPEDKRP